MSSIQRDTLGASAGHRPHHETEAADDALPMVRGLRTSPLLRD